MKYFRNTELAKIYNTSEKTVRNWVQATLEGKLDFQLFKKEDKNFIANTSKNAALAEQLVKKGKKYKNTRGYKVVTPTNKFYKLYTPKQIADIMSNLDIYREIPLQYSYFNSGAQRWDEYTHHLLTQNTPNSLTKTIKLLDLSLDYLDSLVEGYSSINIIDIGIGNALPMKQVMEHFQQKGVLRRYIGIDISKELLQIAEENVKKWSDGKVAFEGYVRDMIYERFDDLVVSESFGTGDASTVNLVFLLGGTLHNFREPQQALSTIHSSMGKRDLLIFSRKLDTEESRRYFEMAARGSQWIDLVPDLLNIDDSVYTIEQYFDEENRARQVQLRLNVALAIKFELHGEERIIEFNKDEQILLLRARHQSFVETMNQFDSNGFEMIYTARSSDQEHLLLLSRIKTNN